MYSIYLNHAKLLVQVAKEHQHQEQTILSVREIIKRMNTITHKTIPALHEKMKNFS
jgi:RNase P subunit RPR2